VPGRVEEYFDALVDYGGTLIFVSHDRYFVERLATKVIEVGGGCLRTLISHLPSCARFAAITFGHVVIGIDHDVLHEVREHERIHVRQYERWGLLFFPLYVGSSVIQLLAGHNPYRDNVFEREAYAACAERLR